MFNSLPKKIRIEKYVVSDKGDGMILPLAREATRGETKGANKTFATGDIVICLENTFYAKRNAEAKPDEKSDESFEELSVSAEFMLLNKIIFVKTEL